MTTSDAVKTIVVATDFSPDADAAVDWAAEIARERDACLVVVHAAVLPRLAAPEFVPLPDSYYVELQAQEKERLAEDVSGLRSMGLKVVEEFMLEPVAPGILEVAEKHHADLIVAGTRGLTGWKRVLLGSVAARLVRQAPCPVVTIRAGEGEQAHKSVRTILVPTDFSDDAALAADAAARLLGGLGADRRLVLMHVYRYPLVFTGGPAPVVVGSIDKVVASARSSIATHAEKLARPGLTIDTCIEEGIPSERIVERARELGADLIAMGTHGRSGLDRLFLGSTAERVLQSATCPVLTVRSAVES